MWKMQTYQEWSDYLDGGRKKYMRPLYEYGMTINKANKYQPAGGDLEIKASWAGNFPFILVHNDDSFTLQSKTVHTAWGGSYDIVKSQGVRYRMWKYTGINVFQKNYQIRVLEVDPARTPSKMQGCRKCSKTGLVDGWCYLNTCHNGQYYVGDKATNESIFACPDHPDSPEPRHNYASWHYVTCEHGETEGHKLIKGARCHSCNGNGIREYGNNPISLPWDGSPLRVKDRKIISVTASGPINLERLVAQYV